jgi:hypothetical protein
MKKLDMGDRLTMPDEEASPLAGRIVPHPDVPILSRGEQILSIDGKSERQNRAAVVVPILNRLAVGRSTNEQSTAFHPDRERFPIWSNGKGINR